MKLSPREIEKLLLHNAGFLAQKRLARGLKLNYVEAVALIASQLVELIRDGKHSVAALMDLGKTFLGKRQVLPGVDEMVDEVQVEGTFPDGTKLITVHTPIVAQDGDLKLALYGSFLPVPDLSAFGPEPSKDSKDVTSAAVVLAVKPGQVWASKDKILINHGRPVTHISVTNLADRPIQVGSHYNFAETNPYLEFDRLAAVGKRLNIFAGTAVRFEPGKTKKVALVPIAGRAVVRGGNGLINGPVAKLDPQAFLAKVAEKGFRHVTAKQIQPAANEKPEFGASLSHRSYVEMFGPTTGDRVRLGDTSLVLEVEKDLADYGDECKFGGGKTLREGMGQATGVPDAEALDLVITNALIVDYTGIYKADIGIKGGLIVGIGATTDALAGEGLIITAGGLDTHIHYICPQQAFDAVAAGLTTMIGGGCGPTTGTCATTCTPSSTMIRMMIQATDGLPLNFGFTGKGNTSAPEGLHEVIEAGAIGLKLHEDWGTTPCAIDNCLSVAEKEDVQVTIHTDTLNESACVEHTIASFKGRTIHTYHTEGAGGGHAPDIIKICSEPNVLPSSTNPTKPFTKNTIDEHVDMLMVCHHLDKNIAEDVAFAESRIRGETIAAEDILHDLGALSMLSSDSQAMGRIGEVITRTWQTADKMKRQFGFLKEDKDAQNDNYRIRRYIAKYTINPAIAHGVSHLIGSVEVGKLADLVLWSPAFFGAKPEMVLKSGVIAWSQMGDANASIPTPQPVMMRPMFGAWNNAGGNSVIFVSRRCAEKSVAGAYGLKKRFEAVRNCRAISKKDMKLNDATPKVEVDPETYKVTVDGVEITCDPAQCLALAQRYFLA